MTAPHDAETALAELRRLGGKLRLDGEKIIVDWPAKSIPALAERLRAAKPELRAMLADNGLPGDEPDCTMQDRLAMIGAILAQRDDRGRVAYTASQVESCRIGLRQYAGTHPTIDVMLARLNAARKNALSWRMIVARRI